MKRLTLSHTYLALSLTLAAATPAWAKSYDVDTKATTLTWVGTKITGSSHTGTVGLKSGSLDFKDSKITGGTIVIDMKSIVNTDLTEEKWNTKLVNHLNSEDFFAVTQHPEASIKIIEGLPVKGQDNKFAVKANLTIRGVTKAISFQAQAERNGKTIQSFKATITFDRTDYNVKYNSGKFLANLGDKAIDDDIKVTVDLKLKQTIELGQN